jgi:hypothetical protein
VILVPQLARDERRGSPQIGDLLFPRGPHERTTKVRFGQGSRDLCILLCRLGPQGDSLIETACPERLQAELPLIQGRSGWTLVPALSG